MNKTGAFDLNLKVLGSELNVGAIQNWLEQWNREMKSGALPNLSDQAKAMVLGWKSTLAAVPAYQKALTNIGRGNKEMLDLELDNIANPSMDVSDILQYQQRFQDNINQAWRGVPNNIPGLEFDPATHKIAEQSQSVQPGQESQPRMQYDPRFTPRGK